MKVGIGYLLKQPNYLTSRAAIETEQKQFIKIAFAVHLSAVISAERYRSDSGALKSTMLTLVYFYIIMIVHKCQQSAAQSCSRAFELRVLPFGKTSGAKLLNFISCHLSDVFPLTIGSGKTMTFENRRGKDQELGKKVPQAYRVYVEDTFLPCDAVIARIFVNVELDEETGLYYYGARYLDPKYSRWLSGDPALNDYIPKAPIDDEAKKHNESLPGMGGVFNVVNLHLYHYAGNNPVKYTDPDGRANILSITPSDVELFLEETKQSLSSIPTPAIVCVGIASGLIIANELFDGAVFEGIADGINFIADKTIEAGKWIGEKGKEFGTWLNGKAKSVWDNIFQSNKEKPEREKSPKNLPPDTRELDRVKLPKGVDHRKIKQGLGLGSKDWTGITPDGDIIVNDGEGNAEVAGNLEDFQ